MTAKPPEPITEALKKIKFTPFEIEMFNALPFPNSLEPKGVWIECKLTAELNKLAGDIQSAMKEIGYLSDKPFKAHITLGRYKYPPKQKIKEVEGKPHKFDVKEFYLVESTLTPKGPVHKKLATFMA